jgi:hypothetical protein
VWEDANRHKKKIEGNELAGLVIDPKGGERLFGPGPGEGDLAHAVLSARDPGRLGMKERGELARVEMTPRPLLGVV